MDDSARRKAAELFGVLMSRPPEPGEIDSLIAGCESYEEFRVALVLDPRYEARFQEVVARWRMMVPHRPDPRSALNALVRAVEALKDHLRVTEDKLEENERKLMDAMQRLDGVIRAQVEQSADSRVLRAAVIAAERRATQLERAIRSSEGGLDA